MPLHSPYAGLLPFTEEQAEFFFGRDSEREIIIANLFASRLTLLYGASGVGKTSVLNAGVVHHLRKTARENAAANGSPEFAVVVFRGWRDNPLAGIEAAIRVELGRAVEPASASFVSKLQAWSRQAGGELLIVLDQFEEYLLYHSQEDGEGTFAVEFPRVVNRDDLRVSFLVSIREDALAGLDRFKGRIPSLFENYLRIDHLSRRDAREAIEKPIWKYNQLRTGGGEDYSVAPDLVEEILRQVRTGGVVLGDTGQGAVAASAQDRIETPYLQLVVTRLWDEEIAQGSRVLRAETLTRLGGAECIVRSHLDKAIATLSPEERDVASRIFRHLVTRARTKIAHNLTDLAEFTDLKPEQVEPVLLKLSSGDNRILVPVAPPPDQHAALRFQIFHDVLAGPVLDWRIRYEQEKARADADKRALDREKEAAEERRKVSRLRRLSWTLALVVLLALTSMVLALEFKRRADQAAAEAGRQKDRAQKAEQNSVIAFAEAEQRRLMAEAARAESAGNRAEAEKAKRSAAAALAAVDAIKVAAATHKGESDLENVARNYYVSPYASGFSLWYSGGWYRRPSGIGYLNVSRYPGR